MASIPGKGWHVEITHPSSGHVWSPDVVDAQRRPRANDQPRIEVTVRKDEAWLDSSLEGATMDVWKDGRPQPIDEVERVEVRQDRTILKGRGGIELDQRVRRDVTFDLVHKVADDIITNDTSYTSNVDTPSVTNISDKTLREPTTQSAVEDLFAQQISDTDPLTINGSKIELQQSAFMQTTGDIDTSNCFNISSGDSAYEDDGESGTAAFLSGERGSSQDSITTVSPSSNSVSVQLQSESNGVVRLYDSGGSFLGAADGTGGTDFSSSWIDVDVSGTDVDQLELVDTDNLPNSETVSVNNDTGGTGGTTNTVDVDVNEGQRISFTWTPGYKTPETNFDVDLRMYTHTTAGESLSDFQLEITLDGTVIDDVFFGSSNGSFAYETIIGGAVEAGTDIDDSQHEVKVILRNNANSGATKSDSGIAIDIGVPYDTRYSYTFDNSTDTNDRLDGPEDYPDEVSLVSEDVQSARLINTGIFESTWNDTTNKQALALSGDRGGSFTSSGNTDSISVSYGSTVQIRAKLTFSRFGSRTTDSPATGFNGQTIDDIRYAADQDRTPTVADRQLDDSGLNVLQQLADIGNFLFEYRVDANGNKSIEWTQPGQRSTSREEPVAEFETERIIEQQVDKVEVKGSAQTVREESFTADHGNAVGLENDEILIGREVVYDSSDTEYIGNEVDYSLNAQDGTITTRDGGDISDGQSLFIQYRHRPTANTNINTPVNEELVETVSGVATERAAQVLADEIADQVADPLLEGRIVIPSDQIAWSVVENIDFGVLPIDSVEVRDIRHTPGQTVFVVGTRQTNDQIIEQVRRRVTENTSRI